MLTIITSLITITKNRINPKINNIISNQTTDGLVKPELAIHGWGPIFHDMDISEEDDETSNFAESRFSTFKHVKTGSKLYPHMGGQKIRISNHSQNEKKIFHYVLGCFGGV